MLHDSDKIYQYVLDQYLDDNVFGEDGFFTSSFIENEIAIAELKKCINGESRDTESKLTAMHDYMIELFLGIKEISESEENQQQERKKSSKEDRTILSQKRNIFPQMRADTFFKNVEHNISKISEEDGWIDENEKQPTKKEIQEKPKHKKEPDEIHQSATTIPPYDLSAYILISEIIDKNSKIHSNFDEFIESTKIKLNRNEIRHWKRHYEQSHAWYYDSIGIVLNIHSALDQWMSILNKLEKSPMKPQLFDEEEFCYFLKWLYNHEQFHHIVTSSWISRSDKKNELLTIYRNSIPTYNKCNSICYFQNPNKSRPRRINPLTVAVNVLTSRTVNTRCIDCLELNAEKLPPNQTKDGHWFRLEEALANAFAFRKNDAYSQRSTPAKNFGKKMKEHEKRFQKLGYRQYTLFRHKKQREPAYVELEKMIDGMTFNSGVNIYHDSLLFYDWSKKLDRRLRLYSLNSIKEDIDSAREFYKRTGNYTYFVNEGFYKKDCTLNVKFNGDEFTNQCEEYGLSRRVATRLKSTIFQALIDSRVN